MSVNNPPYPNVSTFNNSYWVQDPNLTTNVGDLRYLRFPTAQGTETLQAINVNGSAIFNNSATFENTATFDSTSTFNVNPTSLATQPLVSNSSSIIPTTAWVQDVIASTLSYSAYPSLNPYSTGVESVSTWTVRNAFSNSWSSICWSPELMLFVVVSIDTTGNIIMTSPDGITWTSITSPANNQWKSVCWSPELMLFVAVSVSGSTNRVMTSSDGITWTLRTTNSNNWSSVCWSYELGIFVSVASSSGGTGTGFRAMYSSNGINWVLSSTNNNNWQNVCWSPQLSLFVAVSSNGTNRVMTSSNGIDWTEQITVANSWEAVCWSPELRKFCAVSSSGTNRVMTSSDGINWNTYAASNAYSWLSVCWSPQLMLFVATALIGGTTNKIMSSPDGIIWTSRTSPNIALESICWSPELGIFCAVSSTGTNRVITSSLNGRPPTNYNIFDSTFNNIDNSGNWEIKARNLNLQDGLIQGRSDGLNYANNIYDTYIGYCLFSTLATPQAFINGTLTSMTAIRTLPAGVYMISGVIVLVKGNAAYSNNSAFNTSWDPSGGIVPAVINRNYINDNSVASLRVDLPTTYLIITNTTSGGTVKPRYEFTLFSGGSSTTVNYEVSVIRVA